MPISDFDVDVRLNPLNPDDVLLDAILLQDAILHFDVHDVVLFLDDILEHFDVCDVLLLVLHILLLLFLLEDYRCAFQDVDIHLVNPDVAFDADASILDLHPILRTNLRS